MCPKEERLEASDHSCKTRCRCKAQIHIMGEEADQETDANAEKSPNQEQCPDSYRVELLREDNGLSII